MEQQIATEVVGLGGVNDFSLWQLFIRADFVVKSVILILMAPEKDNWIRILLGTGRDKFTENSACSVLRLTTKNEK